MDAFDEIPSSQQSTPTPIESNMSSRSNTPPIQGSVNKDNVRKVEDMTLRISKRINSVKAQEETDNEKMRVKAKKELAELIANKKALSEKRLKELNETKTDTTTVSASNNPKSSTSSDDVNWKTIASLIDYDMESTDDAKAKLRLKELISSLAKTS